MTKYDFSKTFNDFFVNCPGCGKPVRDDEDRHETSGPTWHRACWDNAEEPAEFLPSRPAYGDYEGTGWMDGNE